MIYICEYDESISKEWLLEQSFRLPVRPPKDPEKEAYWRSCRQHLIAWLLFEYALKRERKTDLKELEIIREKHGKPVSRTFPELYFNISHCNCACACMLSDQCCGIDIERNFPFREPLAKRVSHEEEWTFLEERNQEERERYLQMLWPLKESFVKMDGGGLGFGMERVNLTGILKKDILREPNRKLKSEELLQLYALQTESYEVQIGVSGYENFHLAVCLSGREENAVPVYRITETMIYELLTGDR